jgi:hypothetical protein
MAANLGDHIPIVAVKTISGNQPQILSYKEKASQTFLNGVPVQLASGVLQEWDGTTVAAGSNLGSDGLGAPGAFTNVGFPGTGTTFGKVPFQASAVNIPRGAPMSDGRMLSYVANSDNLFLGQVDNNTGANYTLLIADIGTQFGMTKDTAGHWYIDRAKVTVGVNTVVQIVDTFLDGLVANARVLFKFVETAWQIAG